MPDSSKRLARWQYPCLALAVLFALAPLAFERVEIPESLWIPFLGGFHPLLLHLPIGIVLVTVALEIWLLSFKQSGASILLLLWLIASMTASVSFASGFLLGSDGGFGQELLTRHLWSAATFTALCWITLSLKLRVSNPWLQYSMQAATVAALFAAGHFGGLMVHGNPLAAAPWSNANKPLAILPPLGEEIEPYSDIVQPILSAKCVSCHGAIRTRGGLRLDSLELALTGGDAGPGIVKGDPSSSLIVQAIRYPIGDDKHMPPADKPQISDTELAILEWWIERGADTETAIARAEAPTVVEPFLVSEYRLLPDPEAEKRALAEREKYLKEQQERRALLTKKIETLPEHLRSSFAFIDRESATLRFSRFTSPQDFDDSDLEGVATLLVECEEIDLSSTKVTGAAVSKLSFNQNLRSLTLNNLELDAAALACLENATTLQSLSLFGTAISDASTKQLTSLASLQRLYLGDTQITGDAIETLKGQLPHCEIIGDASLVDIAVADRKPLQYSPSQEPEQDSKPGDKK